MLAVAQPCDHLVSDLVGLDGLCRLGTIYVQPFFPASQTEPCGPTLDSVSGVGQFYPRDTMGWMRALATVRSLRTMATSVGNSARIEHRVVTERNHLSVSAQGRSISTRKWEFAQHAQLHRFPGHVIAETKLAPPAIQMMQAHRPIRAGRHRTHRRTRRP